MDEKLERIGVLKAQKAQIEAELATLVQEVEDELEQITTGIERPKRKWTRRTNGHEEPAAVE